MRNTRKGGCGGKGRRRVGFGASGMHEIHREDSKSYEKCKKMIERGDLTAKLERGEDVEGRAGDEEREENRRRKRRDVCL
jgi:hypothetical protein